MEKTRVQKFNETIIFSFAFLFVGGFLYSCVSTAAPPATLSQKPPQLAYFVGYHSSSSYMYYGPHYYHHQPHKLRWTGWKDVGYGCRSNCLIDRWSGHALRCKRVCPR